MTTLRSAFGRLALLLAAALVLAGCFPTAADWRQCTFAVSDVRFQGLRENEAEWQVVVSAINPTGKRLKLEGLHLVARLEGDTLGRLGSSIPLALEPRDTTELALGLMVPSKAWSKALRRMQREGSVDVLITGDAFVKTWFGTRHVRNAVKKEYTVNLAEVMGGMGGDLLRGLFFR